MLESTQKTNVSIQPSSVAEAVYYNIRAEAKDQITALVLVDEEIDQLFESRPCSLLIPPYIDFDKGKLVAKAKVIGSIFPHICKGNA